MRVLTQIAETVLWFAMWLVIPAALLYPCVVWLLKHTQYSAEVLGYAYELGVIALFLPTGFLTHYLYRKFILKKGTS